MSEHGIYPEITKILAREGIPLDVDGDAAIRLMPGQPFQWVGLHVLNRQPVLWLLVLVQAFVFSLLVCDLFLYIAGSMTPELRAQVVFLTPVVDWFRSNILFMFKSNTILAIVLSLLSFSVVNNLYWALICGIVCRKLPHWRWLVAGGFGLVPMSPFAYLFFGRWMFWKRVSYTHKQSIPSAEGRLLQFTGVFALVNGLGLPEVGQRWMQVLDRRIKEVLDSYFSYVWIPDRIIVAVLLGVVVGMRLQWMPLFYVSLVFLVSWPMYIIFNQALLGLATFVWLHEPAAPASPVIGEEVQTLVLLGFVGAVGGAVVATHVLWSGLTFVQFCRWVFG